MSGARCCAENARHMRGASWGGALKARTSRMRRARFFFGPAIRGPHRPDAFDLSACLKFTNSHSAAREH